MIWKFHQNLDRKYLETIQSIFQDELLYDIFFELFVLLFADDIIISESKNNMQKSLDIFQSYCEQWRLTVNAEKNKGHHI